MNLPQYADGQFPDTPAEYLDGDTISESLEAVLQCLFANCGPGMQDMLEVFDRWADAHPELTTP